MFACLVVNVSSGVDRRVGLFSKVDLRCTRLFCASIDVCRSRLCMLNFT